MQNKIVARDEWLEARRNHLAEEKAFTKQRDALSQKRRDLPWVAVEQDYVFEGRHGATSLAELFGDKSQLIVHHFMFGPEWEEGCPSCSFWADNYNGTVVHLAQRDIALALVSRAPLEKLLAYKQRMGWRGFEWYSSLGTAFNQDFAVSFDPTDEPEAPNYNFGTQTFRGEEAPGTSVFYKNEEGQVFHTYSCYSRGLDMLNGAYHHMDLTPKGRDEDDLSYPMAWLKRHDRYE